MMRSTALAVSFALVGGQQATWPTSTRYLSTPSVLQDSFMPSSYQASSPFLGTTSSFGSTANSNLMSQAFGSGATTATMPTVSAYPMSSTLMPESTSRFVAGRRGVAVAHSGTVADAQQTVVAAAAPAPEADHSSLVSQTEEKLKERAEKLHEMNMEREVTPYWKWEQYKNSFDSQFGVPESGVNLIQRNLYGIDTWFPSLVNSPWINSLQADAGSQPAKFTTFGSPNNPSKPIVPCPPGTPELVCTMTAKQLSYMFPPIPEQTELEEEEYEYYFYQMLLSQGYPGAGAPGWGGAQRGPPPPNGEFFPDLSIGPASFPSAPPQVFACKADVKIIIPFNLKDPMMSVRERSHELSYKISFLCACGPTKLPIWDQCRYMTAGGEPEHSIPALLLPYPLMFYDPTYLEQLKAGREGEAEAMQEAQDFQPCGDFDEYNPDATPCRTIFIPGYTPPPPLQQAMFEVPHLPQYPQVMYDGEKGFVTDPYQCRIKIKVEFFFDEPNAWMNAYNNVLKYAQVSGLACLCDQLGNPILNSCKQAAADEFPIPQNYLESDEPEPEGGERRRRTPARSRSPPPPPPQAQAEEQSEQQRMARYGRRLVDPEENIAMDSVKEALMEAQKAAAEAKQRGAWSEEIAARAMSMINQMS